MKEKLDYIVKKLDLDMWKTISYKDNNTTTTCHYVETSKNNFELIFDALFIILYDYEVVIEFNNKELIEQEPVLDKIINVLKTLENGTQSGI